MFDLWETPRLAPGADALYVSWYERSVPQAWTAAFREVVPMPPPEGVSATFVRLRELLSPPPVEAGNLAGGRP